MAKARIASCAIMPGKWEKDANAEKMLAFMSDAVRTEPDVIMTPEGCLEGYVVGEATSQDRGDELLAIAEPLDGPVIAEFRAFCRAHRVNALIGFAERIGHEVYNTALWIGRDGEDAGSYRKTHFQEGYPDVRSYNRPGPDIRAFDTDIGRVGCMICFDRRVPEVARALMLDGAQAILIPSYGFHQGVNDAIIATRAHENNLPVVFCHPLKTVAYGAEGVLIVVHEQKDAITHLEIELAEVAPPHRMRSRRRPELYGALVEDDAAARLSAE